MNDKPNKTTGKPIPEEMKVIVRETIDRGRWAMNLEDYHFDIHYMEEDAYRKHDCDGKTVAEISVNQRYLSAVIKIYPHAILTWETDGDEFLRDAVMHEMAHVLTEGMKDLVYNPFKTEQESKDAWEALTTKVGRLAMRVPEKKKDA